jgi:hypothetical protein
MIHLKTFESYYNLSIKDIIKQIKYKVEKYGGFITMQDLHADASPSYSESHNRIDLIETLSNNDVYVVAYGGYKYQDVVDEYQVEYEKLEKDTLIYISKLLDDAIENELLEEDPEIENDPDIEI